MILVATRNMGMHATKMQSPIATRMQNSGNNFFNAIFYQTRNNI